MVVLLMNNNQRLTFSQVLSQAAFTVFLGAHPNIKDLKMKFPSIYVSCL